MNKSYYKYILSLLIFGLNGIVASYISLTSYEIVFTRTLVGSLFLIVIFALGRNKLQLFSNKRQLLYLVISGAAMGASWMFLYEAYNVIGVSVATLAYYCGPVIVMVLAPIVFREKITAAKIFGFISVVIGMLFVNGAGLLANGFSWGLVCGSMSALMYSLMVIFNKKAKNIAGLENSICQLVVSCVIVAIFMWAKQGIAINIPSESILPILVLGIVNTGIGCYLYFSSIQKLSAQSVSICGYLEPLSALIFSAAILQERLEIVQIIGAILILGGAAFGEFYRFSKVYVHKQA